MKKMQMGDISKIRNLDGESYVDPLDPELAILKEAREDIQNWYKFFSQNYYNGRNDEYFLLHEQWSVEDKEDLKRLGLPILTFNKLYDITKKIEGEMAELSPEIEVRSLDFIEKDNSDKGDLELQNTIDLRQNLMRTISYRSDSQEAYQHGVQMALRRGYGSFRVTTEYDSAESFDISPRIKKIFLPEMAFFDPTAELSHKGDGEFCGVYNLMTKESFAKVYPDIEMPRSFPSYTYNTYFYWGDKEAISVVDYYKKKRFKKKIYKLSDNRVMDADEYNAKKDGWKKMGIRAPEIIDSREADDYKIMHYKMIYDTVLEINEFPSKELPVIYVDCDSYVLDGRQYTQSFIKHAVDSQRALNYQGVAIMQAIKNSRREQIFATPEQVEGFEDIYTQPENQVGYLPYNNVMGVPPPIKVQPSEVSQSLYQNYLRTSADIQAILGYYDSNLGAPTDVMSGKAINAKVRQGNLSTFKVQDNLVTAIEQCGRCILSMIPRLYDTERVVMLTAPDGKQRNLQVNKREYDGKVKNDLTKGNFEVAINVGASYEMQREAALEALQQLVVAGGPPVFAKIADLIAANIDVENKQQLVERLRTFVDPAILAKERGEPPPKPPQQPPPQPDINQTIQMGNLQVKQQQLQSTLQQKQMDNQLKVRDQALEAMRLEAEQGQAISKSQEMNLKSIAEMYKADAESKVSHHNALSKLLEVHGKMMDAASQPPTVLQNA